VLDTRRPNAFSANRNKGSRWPTKAT
jgi:hypothetical protein